MEIILKATFKEDKRHILYRTKRKHSKDTTNLIDQVPNAKAIDLAGLLSILKTETIRGGTGTLVLEIGVTVTIHISQDTTT